MQCAPKTSGFLLSLSGALRGYAIGLIGAGLVSAGAVLAQDQAPTPAQRQLRELYKELVEINTTDSVGSCTVAAEAMRVRLLAGSIAADYEPYRECFYA